MRKFSASKGTSRGKKQKILFGFVLFVIVGLITSAAIVRTVYQNNLKPLSSDNAPIVVTIEQGSAPSDIAATLKDKNVIKSDWAFEWYIRNHNLRSQLKAGTYTFKQSQSVEEIVNKIIDGDIAKDLITILPGKRIDQIESDLIKDGFSKSEVEDALNPKNYPEHPALTDKPEAASLEGYLYPESFQKTSTTTAKQIIKLSLDEMAKRLTPQLRQAYAKEGLSIHQAVTLASIVEQEVNNDSDRAQAAQVFLKRYKEGIALGSDVTAFYGAIINGEPKSVSYDSPYNTRIRKGLPIGPISNVSKSSLEAIANPAETDWLYFVSGDDGNTYFSKTLEEHEALTKKYCTKLCSPE